MSNTLNKSAALLRAEANVASVALVVALLTLAYILA